MKQTSDSGYFWCYRRHPIKRLNYKFIIKSIASEKTGHTLRIYELTLTSQMVYPFKKANTVFTYVKACFSQGLAELHNLAAKPSFYIDDNSDAISFLYTIFKNHYMGRPVSAKQHPYLFAKSEFGQRLDYQ